jgi:hypothetical protein
LPFSIEIATSQSEAQLMAECPTCGAMTFVPLAYAWTAGSVLCCECGTGMPLERQEVANLKVQAAEVVAEIEQLLRLP